MSDVEKNITVSLTDAEVRLALLEFATNESGVTPKNGDNWKIILEVHPPEQRQLESRFSALVKYEIED